MKSCLSVQGLGIAEIKQTQRKTLLSSPGGGGLFNFGPSRGGLNREGAY